MVIVVAEVNFDHLENKAMHREFHHAAMSAWLGWFDGLTKEDFAQLPKVEFRLYDDDGILYFSGWLFNDPECLIQQFVLYWAKTDSGCTTIKIRMSERKGWVQEIG